MPEEHICLLLHIHEKNSLPAKNNMPLSWYQQAKYHSLFLSPV